MNRYIKSLNGSYSCIKLYKCMVLVVTILIILDILNIPSRYLCAIDTSILLIVIIALVIIIVLTMLEFSAFDTL